MKSTIKAEILSGDGRIYVSIVKAAELSGISEGHLRRLHLQKRLASFTIGARFVYFLKSDIESLNVPRPTQAQEASEVIDALS